MIFLLNDFFIIPKQGFSATTRQKSAAKIVNFWFRIKGKFLLFTFQDYH